MTGKPSEQADSDAENGESIGRREAGKEERRQRIIHAARDLIRETGDAGLSMRALAQRAEVSPATPYNLFGSKRAIVLALLEDVREFRERFAAESPKDPLDRLFTAVGMAVDFYLDDPQFYRTLWSAVFDTTNEVREEIYNPKRDAFWQELITDIGKAGGFERYVKQDMLLHQLDYLFRSVMLDWVVDDIDGEALAPAIKLGYAMILRGVATPVMAERLVKHIKRNQTLLQKHSRKAPPLAVLPSGQKP